MNSILIIEKSGIIKEKIIQNVSEDDLYKKAGLKTKTDFKKHAEWAIEELNGKSYCIQVYGKTTGTANQENKYEFPPPIDNTLFFGNCLIVNKINNVFVDITPSEWDVIYEFLYGGFEDVGDEDTLGGDSEDDADEDLPTNKYGYVKDGFVVDDDEEEELDEEEEEEVIEEEETEDELFTKKKTLKKKGGLVIAAKKTPKSKKPAEPKHVEEPILMECTDELSEEEYITA